MNNKQVVKLVMIMGGVVVAVPVAYVLLHVLVVLLCVAWWAFVIWPLALAGSLTGKRK